MILSESPYVISAIHLASLITIWVLTFIARLLYQGYKKDKVTEKRTVHITKEWYTVGLVVFTVFSIIQYSGTINIMFKSTSRVIALHVYTAYMLITLPLHSILNGALIVGYKGKWKILGSMVIFVGCVLSLYIL